MKATVQLDGKDIRRMIAVFFGVSEDDITPSKYSWSVGGITEAEAEKKLYGEQHTDAS